MPNEDVVIFINEENNINIDENKYLLKDNNLIQKKNNNLTSEDKCEKIKNDLVCVTFSMIFASIITLLICLAGAGRIDAILIIGLVLFIILIILIIVIILLMIIENYQKLKLKFAYLLYLVYN